MYFRSYCIPARALPVCMVAKKQSAVWESRPLTKTTKENIVVLYSFKSSLYIYIYQERSQKGDSGCASEKLGVPHLLSD